MARYAGVLARFIAASSVTASPRIATALSAVGENANVSGQRAPRCPPLLLDELAGADRPPDGAGPADRTAGAAETVGPDGAMRATGAGAPETGDGIATGER